MAWILTIERLPQEGEVVETMSPNGLIQNLKRMKNLWFDPDGKMYVYYTPVKWRSVSSL